MNTEELKKHSLLDLCVSWNRYCDAHNREGDCILLNEDKTYSEAFANEDEAMSDILNSEGLIRNDGFLIPVYDDADKYKGMLWVSEQDISNHIDLDLIKG